MTAGINDFRPDDWEPDDIYDDEPEHVCSCNVMHDDLEHAENLCNACGLMIYDPWAPVQEAAPSVIRAEIAAQQEPTP